MNPTQKILQRAMVAAQIVFEDLIRAGEIWPEAYQEGSLAWDLRAHLIALGVELEDSHDDVMRELKHLEQMREDRRRRWQKTKAELRSDREP